MSSTKLRQGKRDRSLEKWAVGGAEDREITKGLQQGVWSNSGYTGMGQEPTSIRKAYMGTCFSKDGQGRDSLRFPENDQGRDPVFVFSEDGQGSAPIFKEGWAVPGLCILWVATRQAYLFGFHGEWTHFSCQVHEAQVQ